MIMCCIIVYAILSVVLHNPAMPALIGRGLTLVVPNALRLALYTDGGFVKSISSARRGMLLNIPLLNSQHRAADVMQIWRARTHIIGYSMVLSVPCANGHCGVSFVACC